MENGEGRKRAIFSTVVTGDISEISPFSSFASFRMRRCEQIKDERAEPNSFGGVTVERGRRALSLNFGSQGVAEQGACKEQEAKGGGIDAQIKVSGENGNDAKIGDTHACECKVTLHVGAAFHLPQLTSSRLVTRVERERAASSFNSRS